MANPVVYVIPAPNATAIYNNGVVNTTAPILLNSYAQGTGGGVAGGQPITANVPMTLTSNPFLMPQLIPNFVILQSSSNFSAVTFTITGTLNSKPQLSIIAGPNNNIVSTPVLFSTVTSIVPNGTAVGNVAAGTNTVQIAFQMPGNISRLVSLTSAGNLSTTTYTIVGTYEGQPQSQTISGPNADTVQTTVLFDSVLTVTPTAGIIAITMSIGYEGAQTPWYFSNYYGSTGLAGLTAQVALVSGTTPTGTEYSLITTLDDVNTNPNPAVFTAQNIFTSVSGTPTLVMSNITNANAIGTYCGPARYSAVTFTEMGTGVSAIVTLLEQGVN